MPVGHETVAPAKRREFPLRQEVRGFVVDLRARLSVFDTPACDYYLVLGATLMLVVIGLVMVLSASSVTAQDSGGSPFSIFFKQAMFAAVGLPILFVCSRVSIAAWKRLAWPAVGIAIFAQLLVFTPLGKTVAGNRNWLIFGPIQVQPSEAAKIAIIVWGALVLGLKSKRFASWHHLLVPFGPVVSVVVGLTLAGHDMGTSVVMLIIITTMLFVAGVRLRLFAVGLGAAAALSLAMVAISGNRRERIATWLSGDCSDIYGMCWQSVHGKWALASGGIWGLGLGASKEKWDWLPEAHNDFIFAIIGEELGLPGTIVILLLFVLLAVGCLRIISRHPDPFAKFATAGVMAWVIGQA